MFEKNKTKNQKPKTKNNKQTKPKPKKVYLFKNTLNIYQTKKTYREGLMISNTTLVCELKEYVQSVQTAMLESTTTCSKEKSR